MAKTITVREGGFLLIEDFKDLVDVDKVVYYLVKYNKKDDSLLVRFYDAKRKLVRPYVKK
jgi:hypothetical protein